MLAQIASDEEGGLESIRLRSTDELPQSGGLESLENVQQKLRNTNDALDRLQRGEEVSASDLGGLEAIIMPRGRPVTEVRAGTYPDLGPPWTSLNAREVRDRLEPLLPSIGRIELPLDRDRIPYGGTGFVVGPGLIMTNRHVAEIFTQGIGTRELVYRTGAAAIDFAQEDTESTTTMLQVQSVRMVHPYWDMALLEVEGLPGDRTPLRLSVTPPEELRNQPAVVIGYPAQDTRNDLAVQAQIFHNRFQIKRLQPGRIRDRLEVASFEQRVRCMTHDASTLGGNSGSAVIEVATGAVIGLHFGGKYLVTNYSVPMYELARDPRVVEMGLSFLGPVPAGEECRAAWVRVQGDEPVASRIAPLVAPAPAALAAPAAPPGGMTMTSTTANGTTWTVTIPLQITITIGAPVPVQPAVSAPPPPPPSPSPPSLQASPAPLRPRKRVPDPRKTIANFLASGQWSVVTAESTDIESPDAPLDPGWLASVKRWRSGLKLEATSSATLEQFRRFYHRPELTAEELDPLLAAIQKAVEDPQAFFDAMQEAQGKHPLEEGLFDTVKGFLHIPFWYPTRKPEDEEGATIAELQREYPVTQGIAINPHEHHFEVPDPGWWPLLFAKTHEQLGLWPRGLARFIQPEGTQTFVYDGKAGTTKIALMSDFGVGHYHSEAIAKTLVKQAYPYVFHLGDVYYAGTQQEFDRNYTRLLSPVMEKSLLFSIPENHELYSGGGPYQKFLADHLASGKIIQEGSYFCVQFPKHQFVAIDVNWNGRQRFDRDRVPTQRQWLADLLDHGRQRGLTTILLTGSAPYVYCGEGTTQLFDDLREYFHRFQLWFWGDDHYCALFPYDAERAPFVGSCIGHAGYPGDRQASGKKSYLPPDWVETEARFPGEYEMRGDLTNAGWVELTMLDTGGVELIYVDWLACKRIVVQYQPVDGPNGRFLQLVAKPKDLGRKVAF